MLDAMAKVWPRGQYRAVHFALDAIHTAQSDSVQQSRGFGQISDAVLEEVSAMKGGASLLAAGYLICGDLSPKDLQYLQYLGLGFQLLDDLQVCLVPCLSHATPQGGGGGAGLCLKGRGGHRGSPRAVAERSQGM